MQSQDIPVTTVKNFSFKKSDRLGKGATGAVYLGRDTLTGSRVAVKVIDMSEINNEVTKYLLSSEKNALTGLKHPNIVGCLDVVQEPRQCFIVTEYCQEGTVADLIKQKGGRLPETEALAIFKGIVAGCKCFHERGVVHRDLKPSNILIKDGTPKISDFGYCQISGSTKPKMFYNVGSPAYMSPQAYIQNYYSEKSDVWALGMIYYEMLTGRPLDNGKEMTNTYNMVRVGGRFVPQGLSKLSETILLECIKFDFNRRIGIKQLNDLVNGNKAVQQNKQQPQTQQNIQQPRNHNQQSQFISNPQPPQQQQSTKHSLAKGSQSSLLNKLSQFDLHNKSVLNENNMLNPMRSCVIGNTGSNFNTNTTTTVTPKFANSGFSNVKTKVNNKKRGDIDALNITDPCISKSLLEDPPKKRQTIEVVPQVKVQKQQQQQPVQQINHKPAAMTIDGRYYRQPVIQFHQPQQQQIVPSLKSYVKEAQRSVPFQTIVNTPRYLHTLPDNRVYRQL